MGVRAPPTEKREAVSFWAKKVRAAAAAKAAKAAAGESCAAIGGGGGGGESGADRSVGRRPPSGGAHINLDLGFIDTFIVKWNFCYPQ